MASRKKNGSKKKKKKISSSQNDLVTKVSQLRLNKKGKGSNSDQLDKDFLKMDVAQLRDLAYPLVIFLTFFFSNCGLLLIAKVIIKKAIALMEYLETKPGDRSLLKQLEFTKGQIDMITPSLKSSGILPRDWNL
ncbi:hypothetical protein Tco_0722307 [Tanacetum coccineum]